MAGVILERIIIRKLYSRDHLDQVLATFALILILSELVRWVFGPFPMYLDVPDSLNGSVSILGLLVYSKYRLFIIFVGLMLALVLYFLITKSNFGIKIRAGQNDREMISALGVNISNLYTALFVLGASLAGLAGWPGKVGWLALQAGWLPGRLAGWPGWLAWQGWLGRLAGLAGLAWGLAGWTARRFTHGVTRGVTLTFTTVTGSVEGYTTTYAGALNTNY